MYDTIDKRFSKQGMANDVNQTISSCATCPSNCGRMNFIRHLQLFPASVPLALIAMNSLSPLARAEIVNTFFYLITDRYSKVARAISILNTMAMHIAFLFPYCWIVPYEILDFFLTKKDSQFSMMFFATLCRFFSVMYPTTIACLSQSNGQA